MVWMAHLPTCCTHSQRLPVFHECKLILHNFIAHTNPQPPAPTRPPMPTWWFSSAAAMCLPVLDTATRTSPAAVLRITYRSLQSSAFRMCRCPLPKPTTSRLPSRL